MNITYTIEDLISEIRTEYMNVFGCIEIETGDFRNTVDWWVDRLSSKNAISKKYERWRSILEGMDITQCGDIALFHYASFDVIYGDWNPEEYWNAYGGIYRTCRSTVIDLNTGETVIKPFDKFFNVNELSETSQENVEKLIENANTIEISEKLDGSIVCASLRPHSDHSGTYLKMYVCTSQSLDSETSWHLAMAEEMIKNDRGINRMMHECIDWTFMFEMICSEDAHVVYYPESERGLHLIGARTPDGRLLKYSEIIELAEKFGIKTTQVFDKSFEQVMSELDDKKSDEAEGFVIRIDDEFFKLKYNDYVTMHKLINRLVSATAIVESYRSGTIDDLMSKVPLSYRHQVQEIVDEIKVTISEVNRAAMHVERFCSDIQLFRDKMIYIQRHVPKALQSYCISAVKGEPVTIFRRDTCPKMSKIRALGTIATKYMDRVQNPEPHDTPVFSAKRSEFNDEAFSV